ncbi:MAG: hypothetical protein ABIS14_09830, partial [Sphingomonas sp.]
MKVSVGANDSHLPDAVHVNPVRRAWFKRARVALLGLALVALVALAGVWLMRKSIATDYVDRALAARGVVARYHIADLGFGRQRLTDVVIGDPRHPDLVADWIDLHTSLGFSGASVTGVGAGHVRLRGRLVGGKLSLGMLDRLLPAPSGKPFALPAIDAALADARMRLETPYGLFGLKLSGSGRLDHGFTGQLAAVSDGVHAGGCTTDRVVAVMRVRTASAGPSLSGPVRAAS